MSGTGRSTLNIGASNGSIDESNLRSAAASFLERDSGDSSGRYGLLNRLRNEPIGRAFRLVPMAAR
jgi:hypothetical protein